MSGESWSEVVDVSTDWDGGSSYLSSLYVDNGYVRGFERSELSWAESSDAVTTWTGV